MAEITKKPVGRPTVNSTPVTVRVPPDLLGALDAYLLSVGADKNGNPPSRPEAIRMLMQKELSKTGYWKPDGS